MKDMKKICHILFLCLLALSTKAQDPQFSQFYAAPLYLAPSMAGAGEYPRLILNYRDQWPKLKGRFVTYSMSYDQFIQKYKSGVGFIFLRDNAGSGKLITTQAGLNYSYRIPITNTFHVQPGIQFQYFQRKVNFNGLTFADQYYGDQVLPSSVETAPDKQGGHADFASSIIGFGKNFWIGFTVDHMMKLNRSLRNDDRYIPLKFSSFGGVNFYLKESLLKREQKMVSLAYQYRSQMAVQQLDLGVYYHQKPFVVGLWYRGVPVMKTNQTQDAITLAGGLELKQFMLTYSYDMTISNLITSTGGAHEVAMIYYLNTFQSGRKRRLAPVPCPVF